jgi:hypothetical protein
MDLQDLLAAEHVGVRHHDLTVKAAGTQQSGIEHVVAAGAGAGAIGSAGAVVSAGAGVGAGAIGSAGAVVAAGAIGSGAGAVVAAGAIGSAAGAVVAAGAIGSAGDVVVVVLVTVLVAPPNQPPQK